VNRFFCNRGCIKANPAGEEPPTPQPERKTLPKPFDPKNPPKGICEICLDPKHKTQHCEAHGRIHYVHKECYAKAHEKLSKFIEMFYMYDLKDVPKEQRAIWLWLHDSW
jgi:hypothetical protein